MKDIVVFQDETVQTKVIAGIMKEQNVLDVNSPTICIQFTLHPGSKVTQQIPPNFNIYAYVVQGQGLFGSEQKLAKQSQAILFENNCNTIFFSNPYDSTESLKVLLLGKSLTKSHKSRNLSGLTKKSSFIDQLRNSLLELFTYFRDVVLSRI